MTVLARSVRATPCRPADHAWTVIVGLLAPDDGTARDELMKVAGIAAALIAAEAPKDDKMVVWGGGPRVHITCLFDDHAISSDHVNEVKLPRSPTEGDWQMSLPCHDEDLAWVQAALAKQSTRITARKLGEKVVTDANEGSSAREAAIDRESFFRP